MFEQESVFDLSSFEVVARMCVNNRKSRFARHREDHSSNFCSAVYEESLWKLSRGGIE